MHYFSVRMLISVCMCVCVFHLQDSAHNSIQFVQLGIKSVLKPVDLLMRVIFYIFEL